MTRFYLFQREREPVWPHLSASRQRRQHGVTANFTKMGKQQCSASARPSATERLDSGCCWQRFFSSTLQAVWWESRLLCGSSASGHNTGRREEPVGFYTLQLCYLAPTFAPYAFDLVRIRPGADLSLLFCVFPPL